MATEPTFRENFLRVIAVIGLIAILLLGAWGIIMLAFNLPNFLSNVGRGKETLTVSVPVQSTSDKPIVVSWKHTGMSGESAYALSYACAAGLQFAAPVPTGAYELVPCNTPFNYVNASSSMQIIPVLAAGTAKATTTVTVAATRLADGTVAARASGNTTVAASTTQASIPTTVKPAATTKPSTSAAPSATYVASGRTTNLYGAGDLAVQITSAPSQAPAGSRISLQFVITNIGTNVVASGWTFNAVLPYQPLYVYSSAPQQALYPGDRIVYTLGYDAVPATSGYGDYYSAYNYGAYGSQAQATIEADPANYVPEVSDLNNTAVASYQVY
jgi:hypothetical protein